MTRYMNKQARYSALAGGIGAGIGGAIGASTGKTRKEKIKRGLGGAAIGALAGLRSSGNVAPTAASAGTTNRRGLGISARLGIAGAFRRIRRSGASNAAPRSRRATPGTNLRQPSGAIVPSSGAIVPAGRSGLPARVPSRRSGPPPRDPGYSVVPAGRGGPKPPPSGGPKPPPPPPSSAGTAGGYTPYNPAIHGEGQKAFKAHYRAEARRLHPDRGGSAESFSNMRTGFESAANRYGYKLASDAQMLEMLQMISEGHLGPQAQQAYHAIKEAQVEAEYAEWNKVASDPWNSYASPLFENAEESRHHRLNTLLRRY